jgi:toxin-antitoxin system PIN domain toxin
MLAMDTNVLVYAHRRETAEHPVAQDLMRDLAGDTSAWAIPWPCVYEFYSALTNARIWKRSASTPAQASAQLQAWFNAPGLRLLTETEGFSGVLLALLQRPRVRGPVVHDARVAALCIAHGVARLVSRDRDFSLFPALEDPFG